MAVRKMFSAGTKALLILLLACPLASTAFGADVLYEYDAQDRLVSATFANSTVMYSYDETGNMLSVSANSTNSSN